MANISTKTELRHQLSTIRSGLSQRKALDSALNERLVGWLRTQIFSSVFSYLSTENEASTWPLVRHLLQTGNCHVSCPKIVDKSEMVAVGFSSLEELEAGPLGILTAVEDTPCVEPIDIAIVPGLAFTSSGARLGYGAGYYDRWFGHHPGTLKVALCFEAQLVEYVPTEDHDVSMDYVITEKSIYDCA